MPRISPNRRSPNDSAGRSVPSRPAPAGHFAECVTCSAAASAPNSPDTLRRPSWPAPIADRHGRSMDHDDVLEQLELAAVEPGGIDRLVAGDTPIAAAVVGH